METPSMIRFSRRALGALLAAGLVLAAQAQTPPTPYPDKPIRVVVTFPPGGSADAIVRMLGAKKKEDE